MAIEVTMESMQQAIYDVKETLEKHGDQLSAIEKTMVKQDERISTALKRIDEQTKLTESIHELASSVKVLHVEQKTMMEKIDSTNKKIETVSSDVEELKQKPAKRWDGVITVLISGIVGGLLTFLLLKMGLK